MARVAINGFGRIGRVALRVIGKRGWPVEVVAINDPFLPAETAAHLLRYDTVYGRSPFPVEAREATLLVDGRKIPLLAEKEPANLPWGDYQVDVVIESSGVFTDPDKAEGHVVAGAKRILLSAPPGGKRKGEVLQLLWGVNQDEYERRGRPAIVSAASCTTNSLGPVVKVLHEAFGVESGFLTTVHAYTADQRLVDAPHRDLARARAAAANTIPTSTGAARSIPEIFPELRGKMDGIAIRVPVPCGSVSDFVAQLRREVTVEEVNEAFRRAAQGPLGEVMLATPDPIVSSDVIGEDRSAVVALAYTMVLPEARDIVKVLSFYDNEWGYACRLVDVAEFIAG